MTRNGKIARMPHGIREELNRRLQDGKCGPALLKWLNEQEECLEVLDEEFESRPITKQNLSEWKQGGYKDWVRKEETRERVQVLMEKADDLEADAGRATIGDRMATLLEVELAIAMEQLDEIKDFKERWARVKEITRELYRLRREDHQARRLRMAEEQHERREKKTETKRLLKLQGDMQDKQLVTSIRGGGDEAWKWTDWEIRVKYGLPMPLWWTNPKSAEDWSELMMPFWREEAGKAQGAKKEVGGLKAEDGKNGPRRNVVSSPKSNVQSPTSKSAAASPSPKSNAVRPGPTRSNRKSGAVRPGRGKSDRKSEAVRSGPTKSDQIRPGRSVEGKSKFKGKGSKVAGREELKSIEESEAAKGQADATRALGAPMAAENGAKGDESTSATGTIDKEMEGMGSMGDMAKTGTANPSNGEPDKSNPSGLNMIKPAADEKAKGEH